MFFLRNKCYKVTSADNPFFIPKTKRCYLEAKICTNNKKSNWPH